jgi:hypothetical protein
LVDYKQREEELKADNSFAVVCTSPPGGQRKVKSVSSAGEKESTF